MKQSIVIPFHKDRNMLLFSLKTLLATLPQNQDIEIIVVGNNRNPHELDFELPWKNIKFYKIYDNLFYSNAVNFGVSQSSGEIITLCDPDIFYLPNWYTPLLNTFIEKNAGAVGNKLINPCTGRILEFGVYYSKFNTVHSLLGVKADHPLTVHTRQVQSVCSAVLMTSKKAFTELKGMDSDLPYAYPDFDYCLRLYQKGYSVWVTGESEVYHKGSSDPNNSKHYSFKYLQTDCKGLFYAKDYSFIDMDFGKWYEISYTYFRRNYPDFPSKYMLIDMSTRSCEGRFFPLGHPLFRPRFVDRGRWLRDRNFYMRSGAEKPRRSMLVSRMFLVRLRSLRKDSFWPWFSSLRILVSW